MDKVLVTGAAGFIGSHLCERFDAEGFEVYGMDNLITGSPENLKNLNSPFFHFINHDVTENWDTETDFDLILHFACPASPKDYLKYPVETLKANSVGTLKTLELAEKCGARYIFASTSEVYGDALVHPQREGYWGNVNPVGPRSVYDEAKRFSEALSMAYFRKGLDVRILRIFNTYGPRMKANDGRVIPNFISQALNSESLTIYGDGHQTRSFCYMDDLVEGIMRVSIIEGLNGEVINLGNPEEYNMLHIAEIILEKIKSQSKVVFKPLPEDDPRRRRPDISKAKDLLGWQPETVLSSGLDATIDFFKSKI
ncbi:UDP-glucuronic acid decarboxylase family protein [Methanobacterium aggregans]|uniref:UDP-glucuronic acid decarboxylase family protein n=1 Tax=Methanobacterium aggregans TaxID=1615586 RepID=UPI001AE478CE|nr:UDP-glucuronic acid decarboxylase family protein [Methanobacterium aggregans]MBP2046667.1 nucleoside-diphosphate-sugar epimerase [Methanobacterium aggregans]